MKVIVKFFKVFFSFSLMLVLFACDPAIIEPPDDEDVIPDSSGFELNINNIRADHPRLFFNADTWESVKTRALTVNSKEYIVMKNLANSNVALKSDWDATQINWPAKRSGYTLGAGDWGYNAMAAALVYRIEPSGALLTRIKQMLYASLDYYDACYNANRAVSWYVYTRICWIAAFDWIWNDLTVAERQSLAAGILHHTDEIFSGRSIINQNTAGIERSAENTGYYGEGNIALYVGLLLYKEGIDDPKALKYIEKGKAEYEKLFARRKEIAGKHGGLASPTLPYSIVDYPIAEWNFFHCWESATGQNAANTMGSYVAYMADYIFWNILPGMKEWGIGDVDHVDNRLRIETKVYSNLSHVMHYYAETHPDQAAFARYLREQFGGDYYKSAEYSRSDANSLNWYSGPPIYPFLLSNEEQAGTTLPPHSNMMHFDTHGQVMMRSGDGPNDTYALFTCGGIVKQHRHPDDNHFIIYRKGFQALDAGTRHGYAANLQNYYSQSVSHNCILIDQPSEPRPTHYNGIVESIDGGQYVLANGSIIATETSPYFSYVAGDATNSYRSTKCSEAIRQFVFVPPHHFIVFDRVSATQAHYKKRWVLHHANVEPVINGNTWSSGHEEGKIFCRTLLPVDAVLEKIGGKHQYFWANNKNWPIDAPPEPIMQQRGESHSIYTQPTPTMGQWRVDVSPGASRKNDLFLHVMQVCDKTVAAMDDVVLENDNSVTITTGSRTIQVKFNETGEVGGRITIKEGENVLVDKILVTEITSVVQ